MDGIDTSSPVRRFKEPLLQSLIRNLYPALRVLVGANLSQTVKKLSITPDCTMSNNQTCKTYTTTSGQSKVNSSTSIHELNVTPNTPIPNGISKPVEDVTETTIEDFYNVEDFTQNIHNAPGNFVDAFNILIFIIIGLERYIVHFTAFCGFIDLLYRRVKKREWQDIEVIKNLIQEGEEERNVT
ncbi:hypothetical protein RF11_15922 [Thelohanellus kitauei]|uniref:Uncharacterized protein n=1 Tax=Thelohanellus kitauei TaxID=669202 RepID=A0A0C2MTW4_THEKT|nr:hypothetical protein RF11_15922 [Thelohanellus kitauei]